MHLQVKSIPAAYVRKKQAEFMQWCIEQADGGCSRSKLGLKKQLIRIELSSNRIFCGMAVITQARINLTTYAHVLIMKRMLLVNFVVLARNFQ